MVKPSLAADASPDAYAAAMVMCQGYPPSCSDCCECQWEGFCFGRSGIGYKDARQDIVKLIEDTEHRDVFVRSWLRLALDALDHHQFLARGAFDALKLVAISKRVREEYERSERRPPATAQPTPAVME